MSVGKRSLYDIFVKKEQKPVLRKGRSTIQIEKRNITLMYRYFYYTYHKGFNYENTLNCLEREFFICELTIIKCLQERQSELKKVFENKPTLGELKKEYDWLVWN